MFVHQMLDAKGSNVITAMPKASIAEIVQLLQQHQIGAIVIVDSKQATKGIITERDVACGLAERGADLLAMPVGDLMSSDVITCRPDDNVERLMETMTARRVRHLPVLNKGSLVGIISIGDVVKSRLADLEAEANELQQYIRGAA